MASVGTARMLCMYPHLHIHIKKQELLVQMPEVILLMTKEKHELKIIDLMTKAIKVKGESTVDEELVVGVDSLE